MLQDDSSNSQFPGSGEKKFEFKKSDDKNSLGDPGITNNFSATPPDSNWFKQFLANNNLPFAAGGSNQFPFLQPGNITAGSISISKYDEAGFNMLRTRGLRNLSAGSDTKSKPANPLFPEGDGEQKLPEGEKPK